MIRLNILLLVLFVVMEITECSLLPSTQETYNCYANSSLNTNASCRVIHTSSLVLHCPNTTTTDTTDTTVTSSSMALLVETSASWWRVNPNSSNTDYAICQSKQCTVPGPLHNEDSGVYYCKIDNVGKYYVDVTILAPPSIDCDPTLCLCNEAAHDCTLPYIYQYYDHDVVMTVQYSGIGEFTVDWIHRDSVINCSDTLPDETSCKIEKGEISENEYFERLTLIAPIRDVVRDSGVYIANVTNPYGYNMTSQYLNVTNTCDTVEPPRGTKNRTITMDIGSNQTIILTSTGYKDIYLWLCFTTDPQITIYDIDVNSSCVECVEDFPNCGNLPNRPYWAVTRNQTGCFSEALLQLSVHVTNVSTRDHGWFMMTWSADPHDKMLQNHTLLTVTTLNVTSVANSDGSGLDSRYVYMSIAGGCVGVGLLVVVVVISVAIRIRRKRGGPHRRRRRQYVGIRGVCDVRPVRGGGGGAATTSSGDISSTDSDDGEGRPLRPDGGSGACGADYGSMPNRSCGGANTNNNNTTTSENESVVLPSESDHGRVINV